MPKLVFRNTDGSEQTVEANVGASILQAALNNGLTGVLGDCGGACQCATCHVYILEPGLGQLPPMDGMEEEMLDCTAVPRLAQSRLGCCVTIGDEHDGMVVQFPPTQI